MSLTDRDDAFRGFLNTGQLTPAPSLSTEHSAVMGGGSEHNVNSPTPEITYSPSTRDGQNELCGRQYQDPHLFRLDAPTMNAPPLAQASDTALDALGGHPSAFKQLQNSDDQRLLATLSKINLDLELRAAVAARHKATLDFNALVSKESPLFIDNTTFTAFILQSAKDFLHCLTVLCEQNGQQQHCADSTAQALPRSDNSPQARSSNSVSPGQHESLCKALQSMSIPLSLTTTSVFVQLLTLHEMSLKHTMARVRRVFSDPVPPMRDLGIESIPTTSACTQGMLFSRYMVDILDMTERALGICEDYDLFPGLLTSRQIEVMYSEMNSRTGTPLGDFSMHPSDVKKLYAQLAGVLQQIAEGEQRLSANFT